MRWRDALKTAKECEEEDIGTVSDDPQGQDFIVKDGGDGQHINQYMRETRRRMNRLEDRLAILTKLQFMILAAILGGIGVGLALAAIGL